MTRRTFGVLQPRYNKREWQEWKEGKRKKKPRPNRYRAGYEHPNWTGTGRPPRYYAKGTFATVAAADAWLARVKSEIDRGVWVPPEVAVQNEAEQARREAIETMTVADWGKLWLADKEGLTHGSRRTHKSRFECHIKPGLGDIRLIDLNREEITAFLRKVHKTGVDPEAVWQSLRNLLITAADDPRTALTESPHKGVTLKSVGKKETKETHLFTLAQIDSIVRHIDPDLRALVILLADAGLRINEALALTRERLKLDSKHPTVEVVHSLHRDKATKRLVLGSTKNTMSCRRVFIQRETAAALADHMERFCAPGHDAPVFPHRVHRTRFVRDKDLSRRLDATKAAAELDIPSEKAAGFHAFRHYSATVYGREASVPELMRRYGWTQPETAMRYQRADDDYSIQVLDRVRQRAAREREAVADGDVIDLQTRKRRA